MPSLVFVLYGVLWQVIDGETKRLEKYRQLTQADDCTAALSICLNYHSFWSPLAILQALRYRKWHVAFSSTGVVLSAIVVPNIQNYVFNWDVYCGVTLQWGAQDCVQLGYANEYYSKWLIAILALNLACALGFLWSFQTYPTHLTKDPRGIELTVASTAFNDLDPNDNNLTYLQRLFSAKGIDDPQRVLKLVYAGASSQEPRLMYTFKRKYNST